MVQCSGCNNTFNSDIFEQCSICESRAAKLAAAQDPGTKVHELVMLVRDASPEVAEAARTNPATPAWATGTDLDVAKSPDAPPDLLGKLVLGDDIAVVEAALANPATPPWAANRARRNRGEDVPEGVVRIGSAGTVHPGTSTRPGSRRLTKNQLTTTESLPGQRIVEVLGLVYASRSHTKWKGNSQYQRLLTAMDGAREDLLANAAAMGANAVVSIRVSANSAAGNSSGLDVGNSDAVVVVGTAVRTEPLPTSPPQQLCPACRELIHHEATRCRYCHETLGHNDPEPPPTPKTPQDT